MICPEVSLWGVKDLVSTNWEGGGGGRGGQKRFVARGSNLRSEI